MDKDTELTLVIARLDRCISSMLLAAKNPETDEADRMTLKHHGRDMIAAGRRVLEYLGATED